MPKVAYSALDNRVYVTMPVEIPALTPLLVSNPADSFDPLDPWFSTLDPSARGEAFSRRYGFDPADVTDPLPSGVQYWIRKLAGPAELKFYRYSASVPKKFEPIFGTEGATNALYWNQMMFHPVVSAPSGTNGYTATFEVYLHDTVTGEDVPNSSSGPLEFNWTNLPDGRPALTLAPRIVVAWPAVTTTNWSLEAAETIGAVTWTAVTNAPVMLDGQPAVVLEGGAAQQYFRMRYTP